MQRLTVLVVALCALIAPGLAHAGGAGTFTVNAIGDSNVRNSGLSLREAILVANGTLTGPFTAQERTQLGGCTFDGSGHINGGCAHGFDVIDFAVSHVYLTSALPQIMAPGTWVRGSNGVPVIDGAFESNSVNASAFQIRERDVVISGLSIVNVPAQTAVNSAADIVVERPPDPQSYGNVRIAYNYLGTIPGATSCATPLPYGGNVTRNSQSGVDLNDVVGLPGENQGSAYVYGNVIGCHHYPSGNSAGVFGTATYAHIGEAPDGSEQANQIGSTAGGAALPNDNGVSLFNGSYNTIVGGRVWANRGAGVGLDHEFHDVVRHASIRRNRDGVSVRGGSAYDLVVASRIGANTQDGVFISGTGTNHITVALSQIGTDGSAADSNRRGVEVAGAHDNRIGYGVLGNVISGNLTEGIFVGGGAYGNIISSNRIGLNSGGGSAIPNADGVAIDSSLNRVGPAVSGDRANVISGNLHAGVLVTGALNRIDGNRIGTDVSGTVAVPNTTGVHFYYSGGGNRVGVGGSPATQVISGNSGAGVKLENSNKVQVLSDNVIGTTLSGDPLGNHGPGILVSSSNDLVATPLRVEYNTGPGVVVTGTSQSDTILPGVAWANGGIGIDLGNNGHTPNDAGDVDSGPNTLLNYPRIDPGSPSGNGATITGTACGSCFVHVYGKLGDPFLTGGGGYHLLAVQANSAGHWSATLPAYLNKTNVTTVANDGAQNSSEFGQ